MRTKDELFRAAQREVAAYRQQAVMQAETARRAAYAAQPQDGHSGALQLVDIFSADQCLGAD